MPLLGVTCPFYELSGIQSLSRYSSRLGRALFVCLHNFSVVDHFFGMSPFSCACVTSPFSTIFLGWADFRVLAWFLRCPPFFWVEPLFVCFRDFSVVHHFLKPSRFSCACVISPLSTISLGWAAFRLFVCLLNLFNVGVIIYKVCNI